MQDVFPLIGVVVTLLIGMFGLLKWAITNFQQASQNSTQLLVETIKQQHESTTQFIEQQQRALLKNIEAIEKSLDEFKADEKSRHSDHDTRLKKLSDELASHKETVAKEYVMREQWLSDVRNLHNKLDDMRKDFSDALGKFDERISLRISQQFEQLNDQLKQSLGSRNV